MILRSVLHFDHCAHKSFILLENKEVSGSRVRSARSILSDVASYGCCRFMSHSGGRGMSQLLHKLFRDEQGQDIAEYAVMLAVILVIVVGTIRLIGSNANNVFSQVASSIQ
jgi:Flp pilus assembly pilin Flp